MLLGGRRVVSGLLLRWPTALSSTRVTQARAARFRPLPSLPGAPASDAFSVAADFGWAAARRHNGLTLGAPHGVAAVS